MVSGQAPSTPATGSAPPDLSRLRIPRGEGTGPTVIRTGGSRWPLLILLLLLVGGGGWAYLTGRVTLQREPGLPEVQTALVLPPGAATARPGEVTGNGYVIARRRAALSTVLSGRLVEVNVEEGNEVKAGQVVARIQHDDIDSQLATARQDVVVATARRAELEQSVRQSRLDLERLDGEIAVLQEQVKQARAEDDRARSERDRNEPLYVQRVLDEDRWKALVAAAEAASAGLAAAERRVTASQAAQRAWTAEIARREATLGTSAAEVERATEVVRQAEILLEKTYVRAPFDGVVVHKDAEVGEVVAATGAGGNSRGSVATIVDPATLEVQVELAETRLGTIAEGDPTRIVLDAAPDKGYPGRVRQVWPTADRQKATVEMRIVFLERPPILKPEMGARVTFLAKDVAPAAGPDRPKVPRRALATRGGASVVFVLSGGIARQVTVRTGAEAGGLVDVESGLNGGETVVLDPAPDLADGAKVRTPKEAK